MTFDEWWVEYRGFSDPYDGQAREAWNAAVKACAKLCGEKAAEWAEDYPINPHRAGPSDGCLDCATAIEAIKVDAR